MEEHWRCSTLVHPPKCHDSILRASFYTLPGSHHCLHGYTHNNGWLPCGIRLAPLWVALYILGQREKQHEVDYYMSTSLKTLTTSHIKLLKPSKHYVCMYTCITCSKYSNNTCNYFNNDPWILIVDVCLRLTMCAVNCVEKLYRRCERDMVYNWWLL